MAIDLGRVRFTLHNFDDEKRRNHDSDNLVLLRRFNSNTYDFDLGLRYVFAVPLAHGVLR